MYPPSTASFPGKKPAEVLIVGLGAVGIIYAYLLEKQNLARVTCMARPKKFSQLQAQGIDIQSKKWGTIKGWRPSRVVQSYDELLDSPFDYCIISTKAVPEVATTPDLLGALLTERHRHPQPAYVLLQNGLGVEHDLYRALKERDVDPIVISCALYIMTNITAEGHVSHGSFERISVGIYKENTSTADTPAQTKSIQRLVEIVTGSGSEASVSPNIGAAKFHKNLWNASFGMISSLTGLTPSEWACDEKALETAIGTCRAMMMEIMALGRALGYDESLIPSDAPDRIIADARVKLQGTDFVPSALLDIRLKIPFELEVVMGWVYREAKARQISTPQVDFAYKLLSVMQAHLLNNSLRN